MERSQQIIRTSWIGIIANVLLAGFKAAVGILASSVAIVMDVGSRVRFNPWYLEYRWPSVLITTTANSFVPIFGLVDISRSIC